VRPSTRKKTLNVDVELAGIAQAGDVQLTAKLLDEKGAVEKTFTQTVTAKAARSRKPSRLHGRGRTPVYGTWGSRTATRSG
jgi:hypothetical protein